MVDGLLELQVCKEVVVPVGALELLCHQCFDPLPGLIVVRLGAFDKLVESFQDQGVERDGGYAGLGLLQVE